MLKVSGIVNGEYSIVNVTNASLKITPVVPIVHEVQVYLV